MNPSPTVSRTLFAIALLLLLTLAWTGLSGAVDQFPRACTNGQKAQSVAQLAYGLCSVLSIVAMVWARPWTRLALGAWALSLTAAGGLAPVVWGGSSMVIGLLSAVATLFIALAIIWLLRTGAPSEPRPWR